MSKTKATPELSEAQLEIMNLVWDAPAGQGVGVAEVWKTLAARRGVARNTAQTMLARLEEKGWLSHQEEGTSFRYFARRPRDTVLRNLVGKLVDTAFGGSADQLVMALLQGRGVSSQEARRIREMIERSERGKP